MKWFYAWWQVGLTTVMVPFYSMGSLERSRKLSEVPDPVIQARMLRRLTCSNCGKVISMGRHVRDANDPCPNCGGELEARADDNLGALARRMEEYREKTVPVADFYRRRDILARVPASRTAETVFKDVSELIVA
jgi:adenylate kinase